MFLRIASLVLLGVRVRARMLSLLWRRLLCRGLAMVLLVDNARGPRMLLKMRWDGTLLLVVGVMLHRGENH